MRAAQGARGRCGHRARAGRRAARSSRLAMRPPVVARARRSQAAAARTAAGNGAAGPAPRTGRRGRGTRSGTTCPPAGTRAFTTSGPVPESRTQPSGKPSGLGCAPISRTCSACSPTACSPRRSPPATRWPRWPPPWNWPSPPAGPPSARSSWCPDSGPAPNHHRAGPLEGRSASAALLVLTAVSLLIGAIARSLAAAARRPPHGL
jgi:hypothetical protein